ncbi:MAG: GGDEF domain-containing protein [Wenzhouxiangella sp.]|nr:GGDEF domain-containing protein [Wenzhouxiangella sp.]
MIEFQSEWRSASWAWMLYLVMAAALCLTPVLAQGAPASEEQQLVREFLDHARSLRESGLWPQVLIATERASELLDDEAPATLRAEVAIARAGALQALERSSESLEVSLPVLEFVRAEGLVGLELRALLNISSAYSRGGQHEAALQAAESGYLLAERLGDAEHRQRFLLNRGRIYLAMQDLDAMGVAVEQAAAIERAESIPELDTTLLLARLAVLRNQGDIEQGERLARSLVDQSDPDTYYGAFAREALADMLCRLDRADEALPFYEQALATFATADAPWDRSRAAQAYAACLEQVGQLPEAVQALRVSRAQLALVHERRQAGAVAALEAMTRTEQVRAEMTAVRLENEALDRVRTWQGIALAVSVVLVLGLMLWGGLQFRQQKLMGHLASHDELTGLRNRRGFKAKASRIFARQRKEGNGPALLSLDLDHFKQVNDRFGHATGDQALVIFSAILRSSARPGDLIGRIGGEEFSVLLPTASKAGANAVGERIRSRLEATDLSPIAVDLNMTCSIGIAFGGEPGIDSLEKLMVLADRRLYAAKQTGRNRVIDADPPPPESRA